MDAASNVRTDGMASDGCQLPVRIGLDQIGYDEIYICLINFPVMKNKKGTVCV